jgi:hypothetical protein
MKSALLLVLVVPVRTTIVGGRVVFDRATPR